MDHTRIDRIMDLAADLAGKSDVIEDVLIVYTKKGGGAGSMDNGITVANAVIPKPMNVRTWHPDSSMRRLGYSRNPDRCIHEKREYYGGKWKCQLCGEPL